MRIAMGLSFNEKDPTAAALDFYEHMSKLEYLPGGSTRVNAGGSFPQLSNCFVIDVEDDMESIAKSVRDTMWIAKAAQQVLELMKGAFEIDKHQLFVSASSALQKPNDAVNAEQVLLQTNHL